MTEDAHPIRVFVAEDNADLASLVERKLAKGRGWSVTRAGSLDEAQRRLQGDRFDVVVLDYRLPDGTGLDLLPILRASAPQTPILFLTAHGSEDVAMQAMGLGATDYMQKDGHLLEDLPARLDALLARSADVATAARVVPVIDMHPPPSRREKAAPLPDAEIVSEVLAAFVEGQVLGAAVFDGVGKPLAALLPDTFDATRLGAAAFALHANVGTVTRLAGLDPKGYAFVLEHGAGVASIATVSGLGILVVLVAPEAGEPGAREKLTELAKRLRDAAKAGH